MKIHFFNFLKVFFTRVNFSKIIIIFSVGLISRILVHHFFDINVFIDFLHPFSVAYYFVFASFIVFINELFSTFNLSILPDFLQLFSRLPTLSSILSSLTFFKFDYFKLSSIRHLFTKLYSRFYYYHSLTDQKLLNDVNDTLDDSLVLHKNPDGNSKGKNIKGKGRAYSNDNGESSRFKGKGKAVSPEQGESSRPNGGENVSNNQANSKIDGVRCRLHWIFLDRYNCKYNSFDEYKVKWNKDSKLLVEFKRQFNEDFNEVRFRFKKVNNTIKWFLGRRNP